MRDSGGLEQIAIQQLKVETLAAVRSEHDTGTSSNSGDLSVTFNNAFLAAPSIGISFSASATGDFYTIPSTTATGFTISIYNAAGARQARAFQWTATGYGRA